MSRRKSRRLMNQINVVPYIDVTLVLLVIFMVTAPMTNPGIVELPQVGQALKQAAAPIVITVKADGRAEIESKVMERDQLLFEVKTQVEKAPDRAIVIAADKNVQYDKVVTLMDSLKQYKVGLLLKPAN